MRPPLHAVLSTTPASGIVHQQDLMAKPALASCTFHRHGLHPGLTPPVILWVEVVEQGMLLVRERHVSRGRAQQCCQAIVIVPCEQHPLPCIPVVILTPHIRWVNREERPGCLIGFDQGRKVLMLKLQAHPTGCAMS